MASSRIRPLTRLVGKFSKSKVRESKVRRIEFAEYEDSLRGDLDLVSGSKGIWKEAKVVEEDWWEQVGGKSSLGWYGRRFYC